MRHSITRMLEPAHWLLALVMAYACLGGGAVAQAETVALMPTTGHIEISSELREQALATATATLQAAGHRVLSVDEVLRGLPSLALRSCERGTCIADVLRELNADVALGIALWRADEHPVGQIVVSFMLADGNDYSGEADVDASPQSISRATLAALESARARRALGRGPFLLVDGEPIGTPVRVDGTLVGEVPYRAGIEPGLHQIEVGSVTRHSLPRAVTVPTDLAAEVHLRVAPLPDGSLGVAEVEPVAPGPAETVAIGPDTSRTQMVHRAIVGPVVLGGAGVIALAIAGYGLLAPTQCEQRGRSGACVKEAKMDPLGVGLWAGGGALAIAGSLIWYFLSGEEQVVDEENVGAIRIAVLPHGLSVSGQW